MKNVVHNAKVSAIALTFCIMEQSTGGNIYNYQMPKKVLEATTVPKDFELANIGELLKRDEASDVSLASGSNNREVSWIELSK